MKPQEADADHSEDQRTEYERFHDLASRILTTPKAEAMKQKQKKQAKPIKPKQAKSPRLQA